MVWKIPTATDLKAVESAQVGTDHHYQARTTLAHQVQWDQMLQKEDILDRLKFSRIVDMWDNLLRMFNNTDTHDRNMTIK